MFHLVLTVTLLNLLAAMTPGPDFAVVTKNTLLHGRKAGIFTSLGIACAILIHISYCSLGLAIIITQSTILFTVIKLAGGSYLVYLGYSALTKKHSNTPELTNKNKNQNNHNTETTQTAWQAYKQGFLTNLLNPKAAIFFLALFTMVIDSKLRLSMTNLIIAIALFSTVFTWFTSLAILLSHRHVAMLLTKSQGIIIKLMGIFLILFGIVLFFAHTN